MNRHLSSTLALAVLAAVVFIAPPAAAQTAILQRCDKPIAEAEQLERTIKECYDVLASSRAALASAASTTTGPVEKVVMSSTPMTPDITRAAMAEPLHRRLLNYYSYVAYASGDPSQCAVLSRLGAIQETLCRRAVADLELARTWHGTEADFIKACRKTDEDGKNGGAAPCCGMLAEGRNRADLCAKMVPKCFEDAAMCRSFAGTLAGDERACLTTVIKAGDCSGEECRPLKATLAEVCAGNAAFARAFKAKSVEQCAGVERCRVLMGEGKAVARDIAAKDLQNPAGNWFLKGEWKTQFVIGRSRVPGSSGQAAAASASKNLDFKGFVCAEPIFSGVNRAAMSAVLGAAQACLTDTETSLAQPSREIASAMDERSEKLVRLGLRLNKYFESVKPPKSPATAPK